MTVIQAVVQDRRIEVPAPSDLPDGTKVQLTIEPSIVTNVGDVATEADFEEGWDTSPEGIAAWLEWTKSLQPLEITAEEEAEAEAWQRSCDEYERRKNHQTEDWRQ